MVETIPVAALERWTLWIHIAAGAVAILAGIGALVTTKGGRRHRKAGKLFVASTGVVVGTVPLLLAFDPTSLRVFLTLVAVFSGYLAFSGYRVLARRRPEGKPTPVDWAGAASVVLACLTLGGWGLVRLASGDGFGVVLVAFGAIGLAFGTVDLRAFGSGGSGGDRVVTHLQRMIGAFIATITAVSAVNLGQYGAVAWLWPTVALTPLIVYWSREYESG